MPADAIISERFIFRARTLITAILSDPDRSPHIAENSALAVLTAPLNRLANLIAPLTSGEFRSSEHDRSHPKLMMLIFVNCC